MTKRKKQRVLNPPLQMMKQLNKVVFWSFLCFIAIATLSCDEETVRSSSEMGNMKLDSTKTNLVNVAGKLFSIPSPVQTTLLIKKTDAPYDREMLSSTSLISRFVSKNDRALNLGIYGADMAYTSIYNDTQKSLGYYKVIENLAEELELKGALNPELMQRLGNNIGNSDSLLYLSGKFYEATDTYLKENERYDLATMILTGGWVETAYLTATVAQSGNDEARNRLAEQKTTIAKLCDVLKTSGDDKFVNSAVMATLDSLNQDFEEVEIHYNYIPSETYADKKTTFINGHSDFILTDDLLIKISGKINRIRALITKENHE